MLRNSRAHALPRDSLWAFSRRCGRICARAYNPREFLLYIYIHGPAPICPSHSSSSSSSSSSSRQPSATAASPPTCHHHQQPSPQQPSSRASAYTVCYCSVKLRYTLPTSESPPSRPASLPSQTPFFPPLPPLPPLPPIARGSPA